MKRIIAGSALTVLLSAGFISITSCDAGSFVEADPIAAAIRLSSTALAINDADTTRLTAEVLDEEGTPIAMSVTWSSSAPSIAPVGSDGTLVGERPGDALITATAGDLTAEVKVKVRNVPVGLEAVTGSDQRAAGLQALPDSVTVRAVDRRGDPVPGVPLDFMVMNGGGVASPEAGVTNTDGMARTSWTLGQSGQQELHAVAHPPSYVKNMKDSVEVFTATTLQGSPAVATVKIAQDTTKLSVGDSVQLAATAYDDTGAPVPGASLLWTSLSPEIATVSNNGWVAARAAGVALISATAVCCTAGDTAGVFVDEVVASVTISPASQTVDTGSTAAFSVTATDAQGNTVTNYSVTWSSDDTNVATVDGQGVANGVAAGSAGIIATVSGVSDTATLTVNQPTSPPSSGNLVNECASPGTGWIWCDDFDQNRLNSYFEYVDASGAFARTSGVGVDGSSAMRVQFGQGDVSVGSLKLAFGRTPDSYMQPVDDGTNDYREIYWRVYVRNASNWIGGGGDKLARATVFASSGWAQAMIAHVWSGGSASNHDYLLIDPASGTDTQGNLQSTGYNDTANLRWLGAVTGTTPIFDGNHVGQWYCVETRVRLNDSGQSNGAFELWIDGQVEAQKTGMNWLGSYSAYGLNAVFLENYWNNGSPQTQERYLDNFVVSTQRIGCGSAPSSPPPSPTVATVQVTPSQDTLTAPNGSRQLTATAYDSNNNVVSGAQFNWTSSDTGVATVDSLGRVFARAAGTAIITATSVCCGASDPADITVIPGSGGGGSGNGATPDVHEDFTQYADTNDFLRNPAYDDDNGGWWAHGAEFYNNEGGRNTSSGGDQGEIHLDRSVTYDGHPTMRYDWTQTTSSGSTGGTIARAINVHSLKSQPRDVWIEWTQRFGSRWTTESPPCGQGSNYKWLMAYDDTNQGNSRYIMQLVNTDAGQLRFSHPYGAPDGDLQNELYDVNYLTDGQWHTVRVWLGVTGIAAWIDGNLAISETGVSSPANYISHFYLGKNINCMPDHQMSVWYGHLKMWIDNDPGW